MTGFEPANAGTTTQCRNHLATSTLYIHCTVEKQLNQIFERIANINKQFSFVDTP